MMSLGRWGVLTADLTAAWRKCRHRSGSAAPHPLWLRGNRQLPLTDSGRRTTDEKSATWPHGDGCEWPLATWATLVAGLNILLDSVGSRWIFDGGGKCWTGFGDTDTRMWAQELWGPLVRSGYLSWWLSSTGLWRCLKRNYIEHTTLLNGPPNGFHTRLVSSGFMLFAY